MRLGYTPSKPTGPGAFQSVLLYGTVCAATILVGWWSQGRTLVGDDRTFPGSSALRGLTHWDGRWYLTIAEEGYSYTPGQYSTVAFFPGYPLLVSVGTAVIDVALAGIVVCIVASAGAFALLARWYRAHLAPPTAWTALLLVAAYPYAYYLYGATHADALMLLLAVGAATLLDARRPVAAAVLAGLASGTRLVGVAVGVGVAVWVLTQDDLRGPRRARLLALVGVLSLGGLVAFMAHLQIRFGRPLLFVEAQDAWGQDPGPRTWFKLDLLDDIRNPTNVRYTIGCVVQGTIALAILSSVPTLWRRFGPPVAAFTAVAIGIPVIGSQDFQGLGRYALAAFPAFALAAERIDARARWPVLAGLGVALLLQASLFHRGYYVA